MNRKINILTVFIVSISMLLLSGCSEKVSLSSYKSIKSNSTEDIVISGAKYSMQWDSGKKVIILKDNVTGLVWSTTPETALNNNIAESGKKNNPQTESALLVTYYDTEKYIQNTLISASDAIKYGKVYAKKTAENTISVMYDFSKAEITVVVEYKLTADGISIQIDPKRISEGKKKLVTNIALAPFACAVDNNSDDSYVFVPSGSGALIYSNNKTYASSTINQGVYGDDLAVNEEFKNTITAKINIPVYGAISGNRGMMSIIEEGASSADIVSISGNNSLNYTTVYADFAVRGFEIVEQPDGVQGTSNISKTAKVFSNPNRNENYKALLIPLQGDGISYVDIAKKYRSYLSEKYDLKSKTANESVSLRILGGIMSTEFDFGIPHSVLKPLTTINQTEKIIGGLEEAYKGQFVYNLDGFGKTGLDVGEIAGGYRINSRLGSQSALKKLFEKCKDEGINIFMNFDLLRFNASGSGFSTYSDAALAATQKRVNKNFYDIVTKKRNMSYGSYKLLKRSEIFDASNKLIKYLNKTSISGVSLDTLSNKIYSDYSNEKYYCKSGTDDIEKVFKNLRNEKLSLFSSNANDYVAVYSDYIDNVPLSSSDYDAYDVDVPFYQMVFSNFVPMYSQNWGSASDDREMLLKVIESGIGISLYAAAEYDTEILSSPQKSMYSVSFENLKSRMKQLEDERYFEYYSKIKDAAITDHIIINKDVRKTVFDNGVEIYVNYSENSFKDSEIEIEAKGYIMKGVS